MPGSENDSPEKVALGKALFFETALSINNNQSCNSCHDVSGNGPGVDNETTSLGATKIRGDRNSPSVWNAGFHIAQFWDGRSLDLIDQAKKPILNPVEMALPDESTVVKRLIDEGYKPLFQIVFPDNEEPLSFHTVAQAIAAFERTLITNDRFDDYLTGNLSALDEQEKEGLSAFINEGCFGCHNGALLGGSSFQKMGLANPYPNTLDLGRFSITKLEAHKYVFKVPSLRDVSRTGPYFHDGSAKTLEQAISDMAWYQLNKKLPEETIKNISAFLQSLEHYHNTESK
ncbi:Cytochrome c551 peroxidase [Thalassocella blandensis]|nr:Cytochrome c551 peroxidase [Thalassocella blandensis]